MGREDAVRNLGQDAKRAREFLVAEQSRFLRRAAAMKLASEVAVSPCDQSAAFKQFQELMDPTAFERDVVESAMSPDSKKEGVPLFGTSFANHYYHGNVFGGRCRY